MTLLTMNTSCDGHYFKTKNGYRVQILQYEHRVARLPCLGQNGQPFPTYFNQIRPTITQNFLGLNTVSNQSYGRGSYISSLTNSFRVRHLIVRSVRHAKSWRPALEPWSWMACTTFCSGEMCSSLHMPRLPESFPCWVTACTSSMISPTCPSAERRNAAYANRLLFRPLYLRFRTPAFIRLHMYFIGIK